jgi:hypothetical protein
MCRPFDQGGTNATLIHLCRRLAANARKFRSSSYPTESERSVMMTSWNATDANLRLEFMLHGAVPEGPQPMYEQTTHGKTTPRLTGQAIDHMGSHCLTGPIVWVCHLKDNRLILERPAAADRSNLLGQ